MENKKKNCNIECPFSKLSSILCENKYCQLCIKSGLNGFVTVDSVIFKRQQNILQKKEK